MREHFERLARKDKKEDNFIEEDLLLRTNAQVLNPTFSFPFSSVNTICRAIFM